MSHIIERRESLLEDAEKIYRELFMVRIRELEEKYKKPEYRKSVIKIFSQIAFDWNSRIDRLAASLGICILCSSVSMKTYEYKLVLSGDEFWLDKDIVESAWILEGFFEGFEEDMEILIKQLKGNYPRVCKNEEDAVRFLCVDYYHAAVYQLCKDMIEEVMASDEFIKLNKTNDFYIYFGRYKGEGEIIYREDL